MYFKINAEKALFIDKLLKTTKSPYIVFEVDTIVQLVLMLPDLSQITVIKLDPGFFDAFQYSSRIIVSIPMRKFYIANMKEASVEITHEKITFVHLFDKTTLTKTYYSLEADIFDLDFTRKYTLELEMADLKRVTDVIKDKEIKIRVNEEGIKFIGKSTEVVMNGGSFVGEFVIDADKFKSLVNVASLFYESILNLPFELSPLNVVYKLPDVMFTTFISTDT